MKPYVIADHADISQGERRTFELLQNCPGTDDWMVLWSYETPDERDNTRGKPRPKPEIDFVVLIPDYGFLCMEVKSGRGRHAGPDNLWYAWEEQDVPDQSPFKQASTNMSILMARIAKEFPDPAHPARQAPIRHSVVFPDIEVSGQGFPCEIFDARHFSDGGTRLVSEIQASFSQEYRRTTPTEEIIGEVMAALLPQMSAQYSFSAIDNRLTELTEEQQRVLQLAASNPRCLIEGNAGTGKTFLAIELARARRNAGDDVLLVCHSGQLSHFLRQQSNCDTKIVSLPELAEELIAGTSDFLTKFRSSENYPPISRLAEDRCSLNVAATIAKSEGHKYDYLIVDEAQAFCLEEHFQLLDAVLENGLAGGNWTIFGDFDNQNHHRIMFGELAGRFSSVTEAIPKTRTLNKKLKRTLTDVSRMDEGSFNDVAETLGIRRPKEMIYEYFAAHPLNIPRGQTLLANCRNTSEISASASHVLRANRPIVKESGVEGPAVQYRYWHDTEEIEIILDEIFRELERDEIAPRKVIVLSSHSHQRIGDRPLSIVRSYGNWRLRDLSESLDDYDFIASQDNQSFVGFDTIPAFSGLERDVVVLIIDQPMWSDTKQFPANLVAATREIVYLGMSRAKTKLIVVAEESWDYLHIDPKEWDAHNVIMTSLRNLAVKDEIVDFTLDNMTFNKVPLMSTKLGQDLRGFLDELPPTMILTDAIWAKFASRYPEGGLARASREIVGEVERSDLGSVDDDDLGIPETGTETRIGTPHDQTLGQHEETLLIPNMNPEPKQATNNNSNLDRRRQRARKRRHQRRQR